MVQKQKRYCRECGGELVPGVNWTPGAQKHGDCVCRSCRAAYRQEHKEETAAWGVAYRRDHKEEIAARKAAWYQKNKEKVAIRSAAYREEHKEEITIQRAAYREEHKEEELARSAAHYQRNPEPYKARAYARTLKRRAQLADVKHEAVDRQAIFARDGCRCVYCGRVGTETTGPDGRPWTLDHAIPVVGGGGHIEGNLVTACGVCNDSKGTKNVFVWMDQKGIEYRVGAVGSFAGFPA